MPNLITQSGIDWKYETSGQGDDLLFIHGWGVNRKIWRQQVKVFSKYFRVTVIDLPGHGESSWQPVSLEDITKDVDQIITEIGIKRMSIVGSSLGGLIGFKYYEMYPEKVKKLIFVGSMPKFAKSEEYPYGLDIEKMRKLGGQVDTSYPEIINIFFRSLFTKEERATRRFKWLQRFRREDTMPMQLALHRYLDILEHEDLRAMVEKIDIPVQFINGEEDNICPIKAIDWMRKILPDVRVDIFSGCGHFPFLSKAYEFNNVLSEFLGKRELVQ